jgi:hypothetical protein
MTPAQREIIADVAAHADRAGLPHLSLNEELHHGL